jgi:cytoskeletal protein RodZ
MEDFEFFPDEEEEAAAEEEGTNRTFIILVAVFGGILALGICAFVVWGFVIYPQIQKNLAQNAIVRQTEEVLTAEAAAAPDQPETTEEAVPIETSPPPTEPTATATPAEVAGATEEATATLQPTQTRRPTVTPQEVERESTPTRSTKDGASEDEVPTTGIGAFGAGGVVVVLLVILVAARRLRRVA